MSCMLYKPNKAEYKFVPYWNTANTIYSPNAVKTGQFGHSVAVTEDGTRCIVGAPIEVVTTNTGRAYIYKRTGDTWALEKTLTSGSTFGAFGRGVCISRDGTYCAVGDPTNQNVKVYKRTGTSWALTSTISRTGESWYGWSLAIDNTGSTLLVGAYRGHGVGSSVTFGGCAYIFYMSAGVYSGGAYSAVLQPTTDAQAESYFGRSVAIASDGSRCVIGAPWMNNSSITKAGNVYIYKKNANTTWSLEKKFNPTRQEIDGNFGWSVSMSANGLRCVGGAYRLDNYSPVVSDSGGVLCMRFGTSWTMDPLIRQASPGVNNYFGRSVSMNNAGNKFISISNNKVLYYENNSGTTWTKTNEFTVQNGKNASDSVCAISGDQKTIAIGSYGDSTAGPSTSGSLRLINYNDVG